MLRETGNQAACADVARHRDGGRSERRSAWQPAQGQDIILSSRDPTIVRRFQPANSPPPQDVSTGLSDRVRQACPAPTVLMPDALPTIASALEYGYAKYGRDSWTAKEWKRWAKDEVAKGAASETIQSSHSAEATTETDIAANITRGADETVTPDVEIQSAVPFVDLTHAAPLVQPVRTGIDFSKTAYRMGFGKFQGDTLEHMWLNNRQYLRWAIVDKVRCRAPALPAMPRMPAAQPQLRARHLAFAGCPFYRFLDFFSDIWAEVVITEISLIFGPPRTIFGAKRTFEKSRVSVSPPEPEQQTSGLPAHVYKVAISSWYGRCLGGPCRQITHQITSQLRRRRQRRNSMAEARPLFAVSPS
jgi:hypothetical protein